MADTDYLIEGVLGQVLGNGSFPASEGLYVAAGTELPTAAGASPSSPWQDEVQGGGYERVLLENLQPDSQPVDFAYTNRVGFKMPTATSAWGDIKCFAVFDSTGNMLFYNEISPAIFIDTGDWLTVQPGALSFTLFSTQAEAATDFGRQVLEQVLLGRSMDPPVMQIALVPEPAESSGYERAELSSWTGSQAYPSGGFYSSNSEKIELNEAESQWSFTDRYIVDAFGEAVADLYGSGPNTVEAGDEPFFAAGSIDFWVN